jgi:hypothetical protein
MPVTYTMKKLAMRRWSFPMMRRRLSTSERLSRRRRISGRRTPPRQARSLTLYDKNHDRTEALTTTTMKTARISPLRAHQDTALVLPQQRHTNLHRAETSSKGEDVVATPEVVEAVDVVPVAADGEVSTSPGTVTQCLLRGLLSPHNKRLLLPHGPVLSLLLKAQHQQCLTLASNSLPGLNSPHRGMLLLLQFLPRLLGGQTPKVNRVQMVDHLSILLSSLR